MEHAFEFDEAKSSANKAKHGIDFREARAIWLDENLLRVTARSEGEPRFVFTGRYRGKHWSAVVTYRGEVVRLISVRRARTEEVQAYEEQ
jgi:uncharacterized DUF497 family protein